MHSDAAVPHQHPSAHAPILRTPNVNAESLAVQRIVSRRSKTMPVVQLVCNDKNKRLSELAIMNMPRRLFALATTLIGLTSAQGVPTSHAVIATTADGRSAW
jgi:hypothetical protein